MDLAGDAAPLVLLETHGAPVQVAQLLGLGGAGLARLLQIADLLAELRAVSPRAALSSAISLLPVWTSSRGLKSPWASASAWMRSSRNGRASNSAASAPRASVTERRGGDSRDGASDHLSVRSVGGRRRMRHQHSPCRSRHRGVDGEPLFAVLIHVGVSPWATRRQRRHGRRGQRVDGRIGALGGDDLPIRDHRDQGVTARKGKHSRAQPLDRKQGADHPNRLALCLIFGPYRHGESDHPRVGSGQGIRDARFPELERPIDGIG